MKIMAATMLWAIILFAGVRGNQQIIEITTDQGCEVLVTYTLQKFGNDAHNGVDAHIEEIFINTNGHNEKENLVVFLNDTAIKLTCQDQLCHKKALPDDFRRSLFSENIRIRENGKLIRNKSIIAAFQLNGIKWLKTIKGDKLFELPIK